MASYHVELGKFRFVCVQLWGGGVTSGRWLEHCTLRLQQKSTVLATRPLKLFMQLQAMCAVTSPSVVIKQCTIQSSIGNVSGLAWYNMRFVCQSHAVSRYHVT